MKINRMNNLNLVKPNIYNHSGIMVYFDDIMFEETSSHEILSEYELSDSTNKITYQIALYKGMAFICVKEYEITTDKVLESVIEGLLETITTLWEFGGLTPYGN